MEWEDVAQDLLIRIWKKYHLYDPSKSQARPSKKLEHWINKVITNRLHHLRRQTYYKHARPCVGGWNAQGQKRCAQNLGGNACGLTPSGKQCAECPVYADWLKNKGAMHNIKASVALEDHAQEVNNRQSTFTDVEEKKLALDEQMKRRLTPWEWNIYKALFVMHLTPMQASAHLRTLAAKRKRSLKPTDVIEYQLVLHEQKRMTEMIVTIVQTEDL